MSDERTRLLEEMFRASPDALIVTGEDGTIEMASPAAEALFGYPLQDLLGQPVEVLLPEGLRSLHARHRGSYLTAPEGRPMGIGLELRGRAVDGSVFPLDVSLVPTKVDGRLRVGAFVRDATERRRGEDLLRFVNEISQRVITGDPTPDLLEMTARRARQLVGAVAAWIYIQSDDREQVVVAAAEGEAADSLRGATRPAATSLAARSMRLGRTLAIPDMTAERDVLTEARAAGFGPGLYLTMQAEDGPVGSLVLARRRDAAQFVAEEVGAAEVFASAAAIVLALGTARDDLERMRLSAEYERIARDLHDTVIQRLFALGMQLEATERIAEGVVAERIRATVESIDGVIREIRETIFDLNRPASAGPDGLRSQLRAIVVECAQQLGFAPRLTFRGPVEAAVDESLVPQLASVARESLSNVSRHAKATAVDVVLRVGEGWVTLSVSDDGVGMSGEPAAGHGLDNMATRAHRLGGELSIVGRRPAGTLLQWRVPLQVV
ncbi:MAG: PAS domain S-box protein [Acidimicrobiales bacterium]|nr:PAS domain S-box protein [Acidimicrobiales bacterium]